jgi:hypothetical protein
MAEIGTAVVSGGLTLLGVAAGHGLTLLRDGRARRAQDRERQFAVFSDFAGAISEYRRAELNRRITHGAGAQQTEADAAVYETRAAARRERYRVEMITGPSRLASLAEQAVGYVEALKDTPDSDLKAARDRSTASIEAFVDEVATILRMSSERRHN